MQNINELIGIIKGINFDGVINDMEVLHLQSWADKNRNLSYDPMQAELINLVDKVLEDRVIDDLEKRQLIESAEKFLKKQDDSSGKIYELNGIAEGIVCDGEVNEAEVYHLREWMDNNGELVKKYTLSENICKTIDDILEDGIVSEEEQEQLLDMLTVQIKNSQFETKLDYLCKRVREKKNIGIDLIDILDNEFTIDEIHKRAEVQLINTLSSYSGYCANKEIVVISLVLIAMLKYDGNYYKNVRDTYKNVYKRFTEQKVEGCIRSILGRYKKQNESGSRTRIINVVLENTIVPQTYLTAFFEFVFDIYKMNFEYDLPGEPYEDFEFVFEGLRNNMLSTGDNLSINVTQKTYKLIAATKQLITRDDGLDAIIKLSIIIVKLIDKRFWNKEVTIFNPYLKAGYEGWEKQLKETSQKKNEKRINSSAFRSRWEPKFIMLNDSVYLMPPIHRVKAQYGYKDIAIIVENEGVEIYRESDCFIKEIIGGYQISPQKIKLEQPLGKITYRIVAGNEIIYDSKDNLYRKYIVFDHDGQELSNNTDFEGTVYVCHNTKITDIELYDTKEFYRMGYKHIRHGDAIRIGDDVFNFSSIVRPGIFGQICKNCYVAKEDSEDYIPVYREVDVVVFEAAQSISKFEIIINGKSHKLSDMHFKTSVRDGIVKYILNLDIQENGIYDIQINQLTSGKRKHIFRNTFVLDADLEYTLEKINDTLYRIKINSGILIEKIDKEININHFEPQIITFENKMGKYSYLLPLDLGFYSIDGGAWNVSNKELWIDDISLDSTLSIYDSECDKLLVYTEDGVLVEDNIVINDKGYYKTISIGFLNSYKNSNKRIMLVFLVDGRKKYTMFCYNQCVIDEDATEILFTDNPKKVTVTPVFYGKNRVYFEVFDKMGEKIYTSKTLESGQTELLVDFNSFEEYEFIFYEKRNTLMLRKHIVLYHMKKTFYSKSDFVGRAFKIKTAYFDQFIRGNYIEKAYYFNKAFLRIIDIIDDNTFKGEIYVRTLRGEWLLDGINPVEVEICSDIIDDTMDVYMTNCGDGLLLDFDKHGILNSLEHPTAPDIFLFTISMKGEE